MKIICIPIMLLIVGFSQPIFAQNKDQQKALAKAQYMLRQVNAEKMAIQQELNGLKKEYEDFKKQTEKELAKSRASEKKLKSSVGKWRDNSGALKGQLEKMIIALKQETFHHSQTKDSFAQMTSNYQFCHNNNYELVEVNNELLGLYRKKNKKGLDPILGLGRVKLENLVQEYSHRIEDHDLRTLIGGIDSDNVQ